MKRKVIEIYPMITAALFLSAVVLFLFEIYIILNVIIILLVIMALFRKKGNCTENYLVNGLGAIFYLSVNLLFVPVGLFASFFTSIIWMKIVSVKSRFFTGIIINASLLLLFIYLYRGGFIGKFQEIIITRDLNAVFIVVVCVVYIYGIICKRLQSRLLSIFQEYLFIILRVLAFTFYGFIAVQHNSVNKNKQIYAALSMGLSAVNYAVFIKMGYFVSAITAVLLSYILYVTDNYFITDEKIYDRNKKSFSLH